MPKQNQADPRKTFALLFLPWLLGGVMLAVYVCTLNHWVTLLNVNPVAVVSGWDWHPQIFNPLMYLVTLPFRVLPPAQIPMALNVFAALCGASALVVLARSVAILPHDRTEMERTRERSDFSFLTGWVAWLPPVMAVFIAGLQLGFWEHATNFTGEMFELLWFSVIVWQLLEYRLDEREGRLYLAAFLYGAGMTEDWALVGFFPVFLTMIIWLRKLDFFNFNFLLRMLLCGLAGLLLLFLLPLKAKLAGSYSLTFWQACKPNLHSDWMLIKYFFKVSNVRHDVALMALTSLLPALAMSIRWSSGFGDSSRLGAMLVNYFFHVVNAVILGVLLWVMFDPPFSPRQLMPDLGVNVPALTLYYLTALCVGYYCGYFLLVFGKPPQPGRRGGTKPDPVLPQALLWLCPIIIGVTLAAVAFAGVLLIYKNAPTVRAVNDDTLLKYAQFTAQNLPRDGAVLLCDNDDANVRSYLMQSFLARDGREKNYPVVDTQSLNWTPYHHFLHERFPKIWPQTIKTNDSPDVGLSPLRIVTALTQIATNYNLCYLNPSFGYYFEFFYQEPHGLIYQMKRLSEDMLLPPALDKNLLAQDESFWKQVLDASQPNIEKALHPPDYKKLKTGLNRFMNRLHVTAEPNPNALAVASYYSRSLNQFGVQLQRAHELETAGTFFAKAKEFAPENIAAARNLEFNQALRAGSDSARRIFTVTPDLFGKYRDRNTVMAVCGPFDEPSYCFDYGDWLMRAGLFHQAAAAFARVRELAPDNLPTRLFLAQIYIFAKRPEQAQEMLRDPLAHPSRFALTEFNSTELNVLAAAVDFQLSQNTAGAALLESEMTHHPDDETLLLASAQSFIMRGLYTNAIGVINRKLARTPDDPYWIYGKGIVSLQLREYGTAVKALTRFLEMQTNNADALYNRAFAYYQNDQLDAARADFLKLQTIYTNAYQVAYGLGEIAWRKHETAEAARNYQIFVAHAPTNSIELKTVRERLDSLKP